MSNRESKVVIFKAALCCGFAIALRALFLVIWRCDFSRTHWVIASEHNVRAWQSTVSSIHRRLIATLALAMTKNKISNYSPILTTKDATRTLNIPHF
ncbi:MAG: hypothetical protein K2N69_09430 [Helicobacter sp.]|nr:hypothetical protein [Helicobacter sp.]